MGLREIIEKIEKDIENTALVVVFLMVDVGMGVREIQKNIKYIGSKL